MAVETPPVGNLLRTWRQRRRLSQLALACDAEISQRHLSFVESGRASPSREMILHLAEQLDIPLRERNTLLVAAGFAPMYREHPLDDPALQAARKALDVVLKGHEPYPALAVDRYWTLMAANRAVSPLLTGVGPELLRPPVNVLRLSLHPAGLAPRIVNLSQWREHILARLNRQVEATADRVLADLLVELRDYPSGSKSRDTAGAREFAGVVVPLQLNSGSSALSFFSTTTVFGTPVDITLSELAIESFFPADAATAEVMRRLAEVWSVPANQRASRSRKSRTLHVGQAGMGARVRRKVTGKLCWPRRQSARFDLRVSAEGAPTILGRAGLRLRPACIGWLWQELIELAQALEFDPAAVVRRVAKAAERWAVVLRRPLVRLSGRGHAREGA